MTPEFHAFRPSSSFSTASLGPLMQSRENGERYRPNVVSLGERIFNSLIGVVLLIYGLAGLLTSHLNLNGRRVRIAELDGSPALLMASAFILGAVVLFTIVIDHYDKRNNERYYRIFRWIATRLSWCLAASALIFHLIIGFAR